VSESRRIYSPAQAEADAAAIAEAYTMAGRISATVTPKIIRQSENRVDLVFEITEGGTVEIESAEGYGMRVSVRLPLTLAIMDGMSVGVGEEVYILPLSSVVESFQVSEQTIKTIGGSGRVVEVRGDYMPVMDLERIFSVPRFDFEKTASIMVVAEADGGRVALLVDELLGQQQVVVKNLEANYRKVDDVSGATIMGDGRVALILDVGSLVRRSRH
jgi:two-component system chemotaxis sensor kinase CheA